MFGGAFPEDTLAAVYASCGRSVDAAVDALLAMTTADDADAGPAPSPAAASARKRSPRADATLVPRGERRRRSQSRSRSPASSPPPPPSSSSPPSPPPDLWDALPAELRLLVLDHLGPREAARAARTCADFAATVRAWRRKARGLVLPPDLDAGRLEGLVRAYPEVRSLSFRRCARAGGAGARAETIARVLRAAVEASRSSAGPPPSLESVDLEGCDAAVTDGTLGAVLDATFGSAAGSPSPSSSAVESFSSVRELKLGRCGRLSDKAMAAMAAHPASRVLSSVSVAGTSVTADGLLSFLFSRRAFPRLEKVDASGCVLVRGALTLPPTLRLTSLRLQHLPHLSALHANMPAAAPLRELLVTGCASLRALVVSATKLETINACQCPALERLELRCERLEALAMQHCRSLVAPAAFECPALERDLCVSGCVSLAADALEAMVRAAPRLRRLRGDGLASAEGDVRLRSRALREVRLEGCGKLRAVRVAAPIETLELRACKSLEEVWIEDPPEDAEEEAGEGDRDPEGEERKDGASGTGADEGARRVRLDLRNCVALTRLVGVRKAAMEGRLVADLGGCAALPASARPPRPPNARR